MSLLRSYIGKGHITRFIRNQKKEPRTLLLILLFVVQACMLFPNVGTVPVEGHSLGMHQQVLSLLYEREFPLVSRHYLGWGNLGPYGPILAYLVAPFYLISPSYYTYLWVLVSTYLGATYLLYRIGKDFFSEGVGWIAAVLFGFSGATIVGATNGNYPNFVAFFGILFFYSLLKTVTYHRDWTIVVFASLAVLLQLHHTAFGAVVISGVPICIALWKDPEKKRWIRPMTIGLSLFFLLFVPYIISEFQSDFRDTKARVDFILGKTENLGLDLIGVDLNPQSFSGNVGSRMHGFLTYHSPHNPLAIDWRYGCTNAITPPTSWITSTLEHTYDFIRFSTYLIFLLALLTAIIELPWKKKWRGIKPGKPLLLLWLWLAIASLSFLSIPMVETKSVQVHYLFAPLVLMVSVFIVQVIRSTPEKRQRGLKGLLASILVIYVLSGVVIFSDYKSSVSPTCETVRSPLPIGTMYKIQEALIERGLGPSRIEIIDGPWIQDGGPIIYPKNVDKSAGGARYLMIRESDFPGECFSYDTIFTLEDIQIERLNDTSIRTAHTLSRSLEDDWYQVAFDDRHWEKGFRSPQCPECYDLHLRASTWGGEWWELPDSSQTHDIYVRSTILKDPWMIGDNAWLFITNPADSDLVVRELLINGHGVINERGDYLLLRRGSSHRLEVSGLIEEHTNIVAFRLQAIHEAPAAITMYILFSTDCNGSTEDAE